MKTKTLGRIQLIIGVIFLIIIIIGSIFMVKYIYLDYLLVRSANDISKTLNDFKNLSNIDIKTSGHLFDFASYMVILRTTVLTGGILFVMSVLTAIILLIILIGQGLTNIKK